MIGSSGLTVICTPDPVSFGDGTKDELVVEEAITGVVADPCASLALAECKSLDGLAVEAMGSAELTVDASGVSTVCTIVLVTVVGKTPEAATIVAASADAAVGSEAVTVLIGCRTLAAPIVVVARVANVSVTVATADLTGATATVSAADATGVVVAGRDAEAEWSADTIGAGMTTLASAAVLIAVTAATDEAASGEEWTVELSEETGALSVVDTTVPISFAVGVGAFDEMTVALSSMTVAATFTGATMRALTPAADEVVDVAAADDRPAVELPAAELTDEATLSTRACTEVMAALTSVLSGWTTVELAFVLLVALGRSEEA